MSFLTHTRSMEVNHPSSRSPTEPESSQTLTDQASSVRETAGSGYYDFDGTPMTLHSEADHDDHPVRYQDYHQDFRYYPTTEHHYAQYPAHYFQQSAYPPEIPEDNFQHTNTQPLPQNNYEPEVLQPRTRQDCFSDPSDSPTRQNTTDQNIEYYRRSQPISPPSTPANPTIRPLQAAPIPSGNPQRSTSSQANYQFAGWYRTESPEERMRVGHQGWDNDAEHRRYLEEHMSNPHLD